MSADVRPEDFGATPIAREITPTSFGAVPIAANDERQPPREAAGPWDALVAGVESSGPGLIARGKLPDIVLNPQHSKWYERALHTAGQMVPEIPEMIGGAIAGGTAGTAIAGPAGTVIGAGAGAFAIPTAIRESLVQAYEAREANSSADFLSRAGIVIKETGKSAIVGGLTAGAGMVARGVGGVLAGTAAEIGTMTVAPAALEGRLPEPQDFADAAILVGGMKAAVHVAGRMAQVYAKTGIEPAQVVADARADPAIAEELKADGNKLPAAYESVAQQQFLADAIPDKIKVQEVIDNPRGTITAGKEPNHINYRYDESPDDVLALRAKIAETFKPEIEEARGSRSWETTAANAERVIRDRLAGMSPERQAELGKMKFEDLDAHMLAGQAMADRAAFDALAQRDLVLNKGTEATEADRLLLIAKVEQAAFLHAMDQGNGAEMARALNARKAATQRGALVGELKDMLSKYGDDPQLLAKMMQGLKTTAEFTKFAENASKAGTWEKIVEAWKAGILSGPITHMANIVGNTTFMAMRPIIDVVAAPMTREMSMAEPFARIFGNLQGTMDALKLAGESMKLAYGEGGLSGLAREIGVGHDTGPQKSDMFRKAIGGVKGDVIRLPFRALSLADDFFKVLNGEGEKYALATRQALDENYNLLSREFRERVVDLVQNDPSIAKAGDAAALRLTFNTPLGEKGQAVQNLVRKAHLELLVPFIRTPGNIFKEMMRMTPLAPIVGEWRAAYEAGGAERAKAIAEVGVGAAVSAVVIAHAMNGAITGQGDPDPNKRRAAADAGWQPYSLKIGDRYYSYQRLQPIGTLMGMAADMAETYKHFNPDETNKVATMLSVAFANAVTQQTFLSGITNIVQVLADPERYGAHFAQQMAGSVVPAGVAQLTAMNDPIAREINGIVDAVKSRIPVARGTLEPKINELTGEPVPGQEHLGGALPVNERTASNDPVLAEVLRLGVGISKTPKNIELPAMHQTQIGKVELQPEQRTIFAKARGEIIHQAMTQIVASPNWEHIPDLLKKEAFNKVIELGGKVGKAEALSPEQRQSEALRIQSELMAKLQR